MDYISQFYLYHLYIYRIEGRPNLRAELFLFSRDQPRLSLKFSFHMAADVSPSCFSGILRQETL